MGEDSLELSFAGLHESVSRRNTLALLPEKHRRPREVVPLSDRPFLHGQQFLYEFVFGHLRNRRYKVLSLWIEVFPIVGVVLLHD